MSSDEEEKQEAKHLLTPREILKWMITPTKLENFFGEYWEQKVLHVKRNVKKYFESIFPSNYLDRMVRDNVLLYGKHLDVVSYEKEERITCNPHDGRAVASAVWDFYGNGCSVRIKNPQTYCYRLRVALQELQEYFGSYVGVNLYLTPKNSQGFAPHWDDIDAFVIQLSGRKHWQLYEPKQKKDVLSRISSHNLNKGEIGKKIKDVTMNTGDTLYFPRGTVHQARTDEESHSLHLTISVYQKNTYTDLLLEYLPIALNNAAEKNVEFRKGLPVGFLKHLGTVNTTSKSAVRAELQKSIDALLNKLFDPQALDAAVDLMGKRLVEESLPHTPSRIELDRTSVGDGDMLVNGDVVNHTELNLDTEVRLLRYYCVRLVREEDGIKLYYTTENGLEYTDENVGHFVTLEEKHVPLIEALVNFYPNYCKIEDFPCEETTAIDVITDLWELGLIVTRKPLISYDDPE